MPLQVCTPWNYIYLNNKRTIWRRRTRTITKEQGKWHLTPWRQDSYFQCCICSQQMKIIVFVMTEFSWKAKKYLVSLPYCKRKSTLYSLNCQHLLLTKNKQQIGHKCVIWFIGMAFSHVLTGHPTQPLCTMLWLNHAFLRSLMWQNVHFHLCCQFVYFIQISSVLLESSWCFCVLSCRWVFSREQHRSKTISFRLFFPIQTFRLQSNKM